jgi:2-dehydropantoate 2-reductase
MDIRKICIVGPGAIGGMMAVMLTRAGFEVSALARPARAAAINAKGITLLSGNETLHATPKVDVDAAALGPHDLVVVTLKYNGLASVAPQIMQLCKPTTQIVFPMNGVPWWFFEGFGGQLAGTQLKTLDPDGVLKRSIPLDRIVWAVVTNAVSELPDGTLKHDFANTFALGRPNNDPAGIAEIAAIFKQGKYNIDISADIRQDIWSKLLANTTLNPISAITQATCKGMFDDPLVSEGIDAVGREVQALGMHFDLATQLERILVSRNSTRRTSMLQDFDRGRPLEISLLDAVVEIGEHAGVPMPHARALLGYTRLRARTAGLL